MFAGDWFKKHQGHPRDPQGNVAQTPVLTHNMPRCSRWILQNGTRALPRSQVFIASSCLEQKLNMSVTSYIIPMHFTSFKNAFQSAPPVGVFALPEWEWLDEYLESSIERTYKGENNGLLHHYNHRITAI